MQEQNSFLGTELPAGYAPTSDEKTMAVLSHILTLVAPLLAPLIIYLVKKDESKFVESHSKESLNFQITVIIIGIIGIILVILLIGILILWALGIVTLILVIVASIRASEGKLYRYPFNLRLIK